MKEIQMMENSDIPSDDHYVLFSFNLMVSLIVNIPLGVIFC